MSPASVVELGTGSGVKTCLLVSGAHGGGSHALACVLRHLGVDVLPAEHGDERVVQVDPLAALNAEILASAGMHLLACEPLSPAWYASPRHAEFRARARTTVEALAKGSYLFALNDPAIALLVPFWAGVLRECGVVPAVINYADEPAALMPQLGLDAFVAPSAAQVLWLSRLFGAEQASRGMVRANVSASCLVEAPELVILRLQQDLGVAWPIWSVDVRAAIAVDLAAYASSSGSEVGSDAERMRVRNLEAVLLRWAREGEDQEGQRQIDQLSAEFAQVRGAADAAFSVVGQLVLRLRDCQAQAESVRSGVAEIEHRVASIAGEHESAAPSPAAGALARELADAERRWAAIVKAGRHEEEILSEQNVTFQSAIADLTNEVAGLRQKLAEAELEVERLDLSSIAQQAEIETTTKQFLALRQTLGDTEVAVAKLRADAEQREATIESLVSSVQARIENHSRSVKGRGGGLAGGPFSPKLLARFSTKARRKAQRHRQLRHLVTQSGLFDPKFYATRYPDVVAADEDLLDHFIRQGGAEGRHPSGAFNSKWYIAEYSDVREGGVNPLVHYLEHGRDEGRRRRTLTDAGTASARAVVSGAPPAAKSAAPSVPQAQNVNALPSELDRTWSARATGWKALLGADFLNRTPVTKLSELAFSQSPLAITLCNTIVGLSSDQPSNIAVERLALFAALRADQADTLVVAGKPWHGSPAHVIAATTGFGIEDLADGWFSGQATLNLRFAGEFAGVVRAFQHCASRELACIADTQIAGGEADLVQMNLLNPLAEVLVVISSPDGTIREVVVLPFPSLMRGGLHYGELAVIEGAPGSIVSLADYVRALAVDMLGWPEGPQSLAIARIEVDMRGANGTEPIFRQDVLDALKGRFGLAVTAIASSASAQRVQLVEALEAGVVVQAAGRAAGGASLILPCDCLPSIYAIVGRRMSHDRAIARFAVVDSVTLKLQADVSLPTVQAELRGLQHAELPAHAPSMTAPVAGSDPSLLDEAGAPVFPIAVRHYNRLAWNVDPLMPVSPDQPLSLNLASREECATPMVTAIVEVGADDDALVACLAAFRHQVFAHEIEVVIAGWDPARTLPVVEQPVRTFDGRDLSRAARLNGAAALATAPYLLFLDVDVLMSDPRTLALLIQTAQLPGAASAACALVTELEDEDSAKLHSAGYFPTRFSLCGEPGFNVEQVDIGRAIPAATYPVIANQLKCCVITRTAWDALAGFDAARFPFASFDLDFGTRAVAVGYDNYCTTLVRAATGISASSADFPDPLAHRSIRPASWQAVFDRVTIIRDMRR